MKTDNHPGIIFVLEEPVEYNFSNHVPLVLAHWERGFGSLLAQFVNESRQSEIFQKVRVDPNRSFRGDHMYYIYEQYGIVCYGTLGDIIRFYFPDEHTETLMLLRASAPKPKRNLT